MGATSMGPFLNLLYLRDQNGLGYPGVCFGIFCFAVRPENPKSEFLSFVGVDERTKKQGAMHGGPWAAVKMPLTVRTRMQLFVFIR